MTCGLSLHERLGLLGLSEGSLTGLLLLVPDSGLLLASGLVLGNDIGVAPAKLGGELAKDSVLAAWLETGDTAVERLGQKYGCIRIDIKG